MSLISSSHVFSLRLLLQSPLESKSSSVYCIAKSDGLKKALSAPLRGSGILYMYIRGEGIVAGSGKVNERISSVHPLYPS